MKYILRYFLQGLLLVIPACFTLYLIVSLILWIDKILPRLFEIELFPGAGILIILTFITLMGLIGSSIIARPAFNFMEYYMYKIPLINLIYSSTKDVIGAFVGDKKKFNRPVLVKLHKDEEIFRIGFITRESLDTLNIRDMIAVYFPDSYGFTGNLYVVSKSSIREIDAPSAEVMKLIVSGGVSGALPEKDADEEKEM
ncbi:MAG TPA: DUF502 domain-containing protein [Cytophagaceae bacterium]|jgi:uncharacterized membrane protein|nr:DUF502 domain-containing protein [Cytophagaceae bacterium]